MSTHIVDEFRDALIGGDADRSVELARTALAEGVAASTLLGDGVKAAADVIGQKYDDGEYFLAELVRSGDCFKAVIGEIEAGLGSESGVSGGAGRIVIATVEGDVHDIGKNLVITFLRGDGFAVDDMGVDVPPAQVVDKAVEANADIIALSCLMSVTRDGVRRVCDELTDRGLRDRFGVLVGGAATSQKWADTLGCDGWAASATEATQVAHTMVAVRAEA